MTFDEKLAQALGETFDERMERRMKVTKKHRFSLAYKLWEYRTLKNLRKNRYDKRWTLRRARYIVTAAIAASSLVFGATAYAVSAAVGRYFFEKNPDHSKMFIDRLSSDKTRIEEYYGLPEEDSWEIDYDNFFADDLDTVIRYTRGDTIIVFSQEIIHGNMGHINTENAVIEPISIYEENDGFFIAFQDGSSGLWWIYDGYLLSITGNLDKNGMVNLALSTKIVIFQ